MLRNLSLCLLALLLVACAQTPPLLLPGTLGQNVQVNQLVSIDTPQGQRQFNVVWSRKGDAFSLAGLSLAGQLLFRVDQQGADLAVHHALPEIPESQLHQLVRQIQWAYWPITHINEALPAGWSVAENQAAGQRQVYRKGKLRMTFNFENKMAFSSVLITQTAGPELQVKTLSVQPLGDV